MQLNPDNIYEELVKLGTTWADTNAAAELLEETKSILRSQLMADAPDSSMASKEAWALRQDAYSKHINSMVEARKNANKAKVRYEDMKIYAELKRTEAANERAANRNAV